MVLDQFNVIHSGELTNDKEAEILTVVTTSTTTLDMRGVHVYGSYVFKVLDEDVLFTPDEYTFDAETQTLTLLPDDEGVQRTFSAENATVTVVLKAGKPITIDYLESQPLEDSVTLLNEGTPPVPKSQIEDPIRLLRRGSDIVDPGDGSLGDVVDGSVGAKDFRWVDFTSEALYEDLTFLEIDDGNREGMIASICEGGVPDGFTGFCPHIGGDPIYAPEGSSIGDSSGASVGTSCGPFSIGADAGTPFGGTGASANLVHTGTYVGSPAGGHVLELSGRLLLEEHLGPASPPYDTFAGQPGRYLIASGGNFVGPVVDDNGDPTGEIQALGGTIGPGTTLLWPNGPSDPRPDAGHMVKEVEWHVHAQYEEDPYEVFGDDIPPSLGPDEPWNPNGPPSSTGHGSVLAVMEDPVGSPPVTFIIEAAN
jgi:hypothetical protein